MSQISEELINKDGIKVISRRTFRESYIDPILSNIGEIRLVKLSEKKIRLDYKIPIKYEDVLIDTVIIKVRYVKDKVGIYRKINHKNIFMSRLSNKLRVKMKYIEGRNIFKSYHDENIIEISDYKFDNITHSIYICDSDWFREWNRDNKLNILLSNKNETTNG